MSSPGSEGEATDAPSEGKVGMGEKGQGGVRVSAGAVGVVGEGSGEGAERPAGQLVCCICTEPWTSYGAHRICCIPCGHVYGRSCLVMWHLRCGKLRAKCPQCSEPFALENIVSLYAPGNLWDGCCRMQVPKAFLDSEIAKVHERHAEHSKRLKEIESIVIDAKAKVESTMVLMNDIAGSIKTKYESMKEPMERLVQNNATPRELMEFMEQNCTMLWDWIPNRILEPADGLHERMTAE